MGTNNKYFTYRADDTREVKACLEIDLIKMNNRLQTEIHTTGRCDETEKAIFAWIDVLTPREINCLKQIYVVFEGQGKLPDDSLLKDIVKLCKPSYKREE